MYISRVKMKNFRNISPVSLSFQPSLVVLQGGNAQGKTNFLEALYLVSRGISPRSQKDEELVRWGSEAASVAIRVESGGTWFNREVRVQLGKKKVWLNNGHPITKKRWQEEVWLVGYFPRDIGIIEGSPSERRHFVDEALSYVKPSHRAYVKRYERALAQRNILLREHARGDLISVYTEELIKTGTCIIENRIRYGELLTPYLRDFYRCLGGENVRFEVQYIGGGYDSKGDLRANLERAFLRSENEERSREITLVGPHRDDILFLLEGKEFRIYGSQGEKKSLALSLKMAEMAVIRKVKNSKVIVLLDDLFSELDPKRRQLLFKEILGKGQVFITVTDDIPQMPEGWEEYLVLGVQGGRISTAGEREKKNG